LIISLLLRNEMNAWWIRFGLKREMMMIMEAAGSEK
jgi:hypothetical protein